MLYTLHAEQFIKSDLKSVWRFISSPANLANITPPYMGFEIISQLEENTMYPG